jgi:hypothetical protein
MAGPVLAVSILAPDYQQSFAALLIGFALSECWRAPSAIMVRQPDAPAYILQAHRFIAS